MFFVHHWISVTINHPLNFPSKIPSHTPATLQLGPTESYEQILSQNKCKITINKIVPRPEEEKPSPLRNKNRPSYERSTIFTMLKKKKIKKKRRKKNKALIFVIHTRWSRTRTHRIRRKKVDCLSAAGYDNRWTVMRINSRRVEKSWIGRFFSARYTPRFANKQTVSTRRLSPLDPASLDYIRVEKKRRKREGEIRRGRMQT